MEEQIYKRQVTKLSHSKRVVDAKQTDRHFEENDLSQLYNTDNIEPNDVDPPQCSKIEDVVLKTILKSTRYVRKYHCHDSLLEDIDDAMSQEDKNLAWEEFEHQKQFEKKAPEVLMSRINAHEFVDETIHGFTTSDLLKVGR